MAEAVGRERDLVLAPNEFIHILDETKGIINTYVGPNKASLGNTEKPVVFNERSKKFVPCALNEGVQQFRTAPEGWYIILKNPSLGDKRPMAGKAETLTDLQIGRKVNIPGPVSFPLWPGQMAKVIKGHHIRSNEYLVGRVYDDEAAKKHWSSAIVKSNVGEGDTKDTKEPTIAAPQLTMGQQIIIKGTGVSFFIPPTGIEIVPNEEGAYVHQAVTLERLEYCILLDESGNKRFLKGPDVVFPQPTENFLRRKGEDGKVTRKFRAIELNPQMGLYIKVIAPYDEDGQKFSAGDELFLTGDTVKIYYPRPEHAIMRYGDGNEIHYAVAVPAGEGRYVMDKPSGNIMTVRGPSMLLPDPRYKVVVNRALSQRMCGLMYPGNKEALYHNTQLTTMMGEDGVEKMLRESQYSSRLYSSSNTPVEAGDPEMGLLRFAPEARTQEEKTGGGTNAPAGQKLRTSRRAGLVADDFTRGTTFTPPRSITLNTKFQGAVMVSIWTGYAVQVSSKSGTRRVEIGPKNLILDYDESLDVIKLSSGRPKGSQEVKEDVYLRVHNNKISDLVEAESSDMVGVNMTLSYRVNFEGEDPNRWFEVEDYVKFLCDHARSMLRNAIKKVKIEEFNMNPIDLVRDTILGKTIEGKRPGRLFQENNMRIYDVEVLDVTIGDREISALINSTQHTVVRQSLELANKERTLIAEKRAEEIQRALEAEKSKTSLAKINTLMQENAAAAEVELQRVKAAAALETAKLVATEENQEILHEITVAENERWSSREDLKLTYDKARLEMEIHGIASKSQAWVNQANSIQPSLIAAMQSVADTQMLSETFKSVAPMALVGNKSVFDVVQGLIKGTKLEGLLTDSTPK